MVDEIRNEDLTTQDAGEETMESFMEKMGGIEDIHRGKVVEGVVVDVRDDGWLIDVSYKCEGFLPRKEWTHRVLVKSAEEPAVGDKAVS